jgi:hypothetical protein
MRVRLRGARALLLLLAFLWPLASAQAQERRVALVVGADRYQTLTPLENGANDARAMAQRLTALGHEVRTMPSLDSGFGHAHAIVVGDDEMLSGAADPRARIGSAAGI